MACAGRSRQRGVVMVVALIVLVVMTLAGISLMRSMDTTNLIAGNMAFKQAALHSGDPGLEQAIGWLETNSNFVTTDHPEAGYRSYTLGNASMKLGQDFWNNQLPGGVCRLPMVGGACSPTDVQDPVTGNKVSFMIQRLCDGVGTRESGASCAVASSQVLSVGDNEGPDSVGSTDSSAIFYRITVRVDGLRNAVSFVQAIVYM